MIKRTVDVALVLLSAPLWLPLIGVLCLVVKINLGSPVFFRQMRPGLHGKLFELVKFRTMANARCDRGDLLPDADRMSQFGQWLRSTSLDELPELLHVLSGRMSLVGPRPLLPQYLARYSTRQAKRHDVRPGLTGWSQVNGRNALSWPEKLEMDVWYVENQSLRLDLKILALTFRKVLSKDGVSAPGAATAPEFKGE